VKPADDESAELRIERFERGNKGVKAAPAIDP